jgi:hypothetical protein
MSPHRLRARIARLERAPIFLIGRDPSCDLARHFQLLVHRLRRGLTSLEALEAKKLTAHFDQLVRDRSIKHRDHAKENNENNTHVGCFRQR